MQSVQSKMDYIYTQVTANTVSGPWGTAAKALIESMKTTFDNVSDVMIQDRTKVIHSIGQVAKIELVGYNNNGYTGALQGSNNIGLLRAGFIAKPNGKLFQIGIAMKILRSKVLSANIVAFNNPDGQKEFDFFTHPM